MHSHILLPTSPMSSLNSDLDLSSLAQSRRRYSTTTLPSLRLSRHKTLMINVNNKPHARRRPRGESLNFPGPRLCTPPSSLAGCIGILHILKFYGGSKHVKGCLMEATGGIADREEEVNVGDRES